MKKENLSIPTNIYLNDRMLVSVLLQICVLHRDHVMLLLLLFFVMHVVDSFAVAVFLRDKCRIWNQIISSENEREL